MKLNVIIEHIDHGLLTLPQFQRGYVWSGKQVRHFMESLYRDYPVGILLIWQTRANQQTVKGKQPLALGMHELLLDGQQRVTSLYGIVKGAPPPFCEGNCKAFLNLYFNVEEQQFEFYRANKMQHNPHWVSVTELMQNDEWYFEHRFEGNPDKSTFLKRLSRIVKIRDYEFKEQKLIGDRFTMEEVVNIFDQVNSGGTKLSKGDLALAKICADWPQAREEMQKRLDKWGQYGYRFSLDWLLRCINALVTGHGDFEELSRRKVTPAQVSDGLQRVERHVDTVLNLMSAYLGLDDSAVLRSPNSIPAIVSFLDKSHSLPDQRQLSRLLYWYALSALRGRYSSAVETRVRQDLVAIAESDDPVSALIQLLKDDYRDLALWAGNFDASTARSRFFPTLYMLTRVYGARDFGTGIVLNKAMIGKMGRLERHHLFPKWQLHQHGIRKVSDVNALANFTFLTKDTNLAISARKPEDYFPEYEDRHPGVLDSHWIPRDRDLWKIENYFDFLAARRDLLAKAANEFLNGLNQGKFAHDAPPTHLIERVAPPKPASVASDEEESDLQQAMTWMETNNLPRGNYGYELVDLNGELLATLDLAWPRGIQEGYGRPAALLINESEETRNIAEDQDFKCFTSLAQLQAYVQRDILGE